MVVARSRYPERVTPVQTSEFELNRTELDSEMDATTEAGNTTGGGIGKERDGVTVDVEA